MLQAAGTAVPSFVSTLLTQLPPDQDHENTHQAGLIRDTAVAMYGAAMDSVGYLLPLLILMFKSFAQSVSLMFAFMGVMVLYPEVQRRAQCELDAILGHERLPVFDDRLSLPFIDAIVLEVLRWNVVTPLGMVSLLPSFRVAHAHPGFPHMVTEEDEYLGYRIPKGAAVVGNMWYVSLLPQARIRDYLTLSGQS